MLLALLPVFLLVVILIVFCFTILQCRPTNYPPGPPWWPIMGNTSLLRSLTRKLKYQHLALSHLASLYQTDVLGLKLGSDLVVVVLTAPLVKEVLMRDEFAARPDSFFIRLRCFGSRKGVTCTDGPVWQEHRAFTLRHLRDLGFGKSAMEDLILEELEELLQVLAQGPNSVNLGQELAPSILSVLWALAAGKRLKRSEKRLQRLLELLSLRSRAFDMAGGLLNQFPWLRFVAPDKTGYSLLTKLNSELKEFLMETIEEHKQTIADGEPRDLIDSYLQEKMRREKDAGSTFTDDQLVMTLLDLFIAGAQTTSNTLDFAFLLMIKHPDIQEKVYLEIINTVGVDKVVSLSDKIRLPYTEAVLLEVQRLCHVTPITGPRRALTDTTINGYAIPKGTTILVSQWSVHRDEAIFQNSSKFLPERFLVKNGAEHDNLIPFGLGRRRCLGESLAKSCILLMFAGIIQKFQLSKIDDQPEPSLEPLPGITLAPTYYQACLALR